MRRSRSPTASTTVSRAASGPTTSAGPTAWRRRSTPGTCGSMGHPRTSRGCRSAGSSCPASAARRAWTNCSATPSSRPSTSCSAEAGNGPGGTQEDNGVNGAEVAIEALRREGVRHIVGLPGTTIMHLIDAAGRSQGLRYLSARHEQVAAFMADGYARAADGVGVCVASRGPGAANLAIGVHNAHAESIPVLALVGQVPDEIRHREAFEEMDLVRFFAPITKWSLEIHRPGRIAELLQRAVRTALSGRPGPVMVSLPLDVQTAEAAARYQASARAVPPAAPAAAVEAAVARLASAQRPVIIVGGGARGPGYSPGLVKLAERLAIPVVTTWLRKNAFPNDSPLFCGSLGYGALAVTEDLVREADLVLAAGCRFSEFSTGRWTLLSPGTALVQIDIDPDALGRTYVPDIGICADISQAAQALADAAEETGTSPPPGRAAWAAAVRADYQQQASPPGPAPGA